jgi:hypothetical protein
MISATRFAANAGWEIKNIAAARQMLHQLKNPGQRIVTLLGTSQTLGLAYQDCRPASCEPDHEVTRNLFGKNPL